MFRNYKDYDFTYDGRVWSYKRNKWMKPIITRDGYYRICLYEDGEKKMFSNHRATYEAVSGKPIPEGMQVNHIDENKLNNHFDNLNLMTPKENCNWGTRNERVGKASGKARTNNPKVIAALTNNPNLSKRVQAFDKDGNLVFDFPSSHEAQRKMGFNQSNIIQCCKGKLKSAYGFIWRYVE